MVNDGTFRPPRPAGMDPEVFELISRCWQVGLTTLTTKVLLNMAKAVRQIFRSCASWLNRLPVGFIGTLGVRKRTPFHVNNRQGTGGHQGETAGLTSGLHFWRSLLCDLLSSVSGMMANCGNLMGAYQTVKEK